LLGFPLRVVALLFGYSSILGRRLVVVLLSFPLCVVVVVLLFIEESCSTLLHSFLQELEMVGS
jgi:hypothetical protein